MKKTLNQTAITNGYIERELKLTGVTVAFVSDGSTAWLEINGSQASPLYEIEKINSDEEMKKVVLTIHNTINVLHMMARGELPNGKTG